MDFRSFQESCRGFRRVSNALWGVTEVFEGFHCPISVFGVSAAFQEFSAGFQTGSLWKRFREFQRRFDEFQGRCRGFQGVTKGFKGFWDRFRDFPEFSEPVFFQVNGV